MAKRKFGVFLFVLTFLGLIGCDNGNLYSPTVPSTTGNDTLGNLKEVVTDGFGSGIPSRINGVELLQIRGWLANIYSEWHYQPQKSTVHPVRLLWSPNQQQSYAEIQNQSKQLQQYGSGADVIEFNPVYGVSYWSSNYFGATSRPFFVLYEHINGTRYTCSSDCSTDMDIESNRQVFREDIDYIFKNVIIPNHSRYVVVDGRAVIYMWAGASMKGNFASLLEEVKSKYPVFFITSGMWRQISDRAALKAWDGFMEYNLGGHTYLSAIQSYASASLGWSHTLRQLEAETGKKYIFIPTFQAAYDDSKTGRASLTTMYSRSKEEMEYHAELVRSGMGNIYDNIGPFVVYSELFEGAAVIESQCLPETMDRPGRYVGCGTERLKILKRFFGG